jgi:MFS family permease
VTKLRLARIFWIGAAAILIAAALVALVAVLRGDFSDTDGRALVTLAALLYTGAAALSGLALVDRKRATALGWLVAVSAPVGLALILWAVWSFAFDEGGDRATDKLAWSSAILLLAGLLSTTALLLARRPTLVRLAAVAGAAAGVAAGISVIGVWAEPDNESFVKGVAVAWILAALGFFLVPVLQRFTSTGEDVQSERVLAELDGVELVATRAADGIEPSLAAGERLALRRSVPTR